MDLTEALNELLKEKSLWAVYKSAPSVLKNRFNRITLACTLAVLSIFAVLSYVTQLGRSYGLPTLNIFDVFGKWAEVGIAYASTILGFLLAGFSVLFTLLKPSTALPLLLGKSEQPELSQLKFIFFVFIDVFVHYTAFLFWCFGFFVLGSRGGAFDWLYRWMAAILPNVARCSALIIFVCWGAWFVLLLLKLKSFIWNLYQVLLVSLADSIESSDDGQK